CVNPDLGGSRLRRPIGGPTRWNFLRSGLIGPKGYLISEFPYLQLKLPNVSFSNSITGQIPASSLAWPSGIEWLIKGCFGLRILNDEDHPHCRCIAICHKDTMESLDSVCARRERTPNKRSCYPWHFVDADHRVGPADRGRHRVAARGI